MGVAFLVHSWTIDRDKPESAVYGPLSGQVLFALEVFVGISGNGVVLLVSGGFLFVFFLFFDFIWVSVEEEIWHDVPFFRSAEGSLQSLDFSGQKPVSQTNTVGGFVVARVHFLFVVLNPVGRGQSGVGESVM